MKKLSTCGMTSGLLALASAVVVLAAAFLLALPTPALAAERVFAHSIDKAGNRTDYTSIAAAKTAGYEGADIIMDMDWDLGDDYLEIADSKWLTIDLNGHEITSSNSNRTIYLNENAYLKLTSSIEPKTFRFAGYDSFGKEKDGLTVSAGGLVTNTRDETAGWGSVVHMEYRSKVVIQNVAIAGGGHSGIDTSSSCWIDLQRATICYNSRSANNDSGQGGGIYLNNGGTITMTESHIDDNYSNGQGGGIYTESHASITMEKDSTVSRNRACSGAGIYFSASQFLLRCTDKTATISENVAFAGGASAFTEHRSGGGIRTYSVNSDDAVGKIEGINIKDNYSARDGGGLELDQKNTTVRDCVITGNAAACDGGGAFVFDKDITFERCTVTNNYCDADNGGYEGGGIFVSYHYDLNVKGKNIIKGNTRGKNSGNADDVFLGTVSGDTGRAYIKGSLDQGSSVGVRTGIEGDRRIAEEFKPESKDCLFMDLSGYYVSYGTDEGGDAWQRHATKEFTATVNGQNAVKYLQGAKATLVAPATMGDDLVFWHWDLDKTTGLYPIGDYISDEAAFNNTITFAMPQNDVNAVPVYVTRAKKVAIAVDAPVAGEALPASAALYRLDGAGLRGPFDATVAWYEVGADGSRTSASGTAKAGTAYAAEITVKGNNGYGLYFSPSILAGDVTLKAGDADGPAVEAASVDSGTGALTVKTAAFAKTAGEAKPAVTSVEAAAVTVAAAEPEQALRDLLPTTAQAKTDAGTTVTLKVKKDGFDLTASGLIVNGHVAPPAGGAAATLEIPVESADGAVTVPEGTTVKVTVTVTGNGDDESGFPDVDYSEGGWYADSATWCAANGLILGYPNGLFGVGDTMSRAQLATILWRHYEPEAAAGYDEAMPTTEGTDDVDGIEDAQYYTAAANWAVASGVIDGFEREGSAKRDFAPCGEVSFEQLVSIVAKASGADYESSDLSVLDRFADKDAVSPWAAHAMAWAVEEGLVSGWDNGAENLRELKPAEPVARERAAVVLANAFSAGVLK